MNTKSEFKLILPYMNELFLKVFSSLIMCIIWLRVNKAMLSIGILIWIYLNGIYALYTSWVITEETRKKIQKDEAVTSEGKTMPQEQTLFIQKDDLVQKGKSLDICFLWSITPSKLPLHTLIDKLKKSKKWFDKM